MRATSSGTVVLLRARRDVHVGARHARDLQRDRGPAARTP